MKNYFPSNGTEGSWFLANTCTNCYKKNNCSIIYKSYGGIQPKQWVYDENDKPTCTAFAVKPIKKNPRVKKDDNLKLF